MKPAFDDS